MSYKICPHCGRRVNSSAINCGFCGGRLSSGTRGGFSGSSRSGMVECPHCGRMVKSSAISCGFCGGRLSSGTRGGFSGSSRSGMVECPHCGRMVNSSAISCGFCGNRLSGGSNISTNGDYNSNFTRCPNCGTFVRKNKKVCPKCNYNFKKSKVNKPKTNKSKMTKPKINKPVNVKHFDDGVVSFDYADNYSKDFNSKYKDLDILASFKIGSRNDFDSSFAIFDGQPLNDEVPDSKFKEIIRKSLNSDILEINRYSSGEKERIIIEIRNNANSNLEYYCIVPEIGFSVLFVIPYGKEHLFNKKYISTVVDSLEKSSGKPITEPVSSSTPKRTVKSSVIKEKTKTCPNCGSENPDDSNFCMECGMKLDISNDVNFCIHCGTEVVPGAKFCMNCGKLIEY
jgi:RNA polymerase subunit RPABC4/transcription elongation factor Spt4